MSFHYRAVCIYGGVFHFSCVYDSVMFAYFAANKIIDRSCAEEPEVMDMRGWSPFMEHWTFEKIVNLR